MRGFTVSILFVLLIHSTFGILPPPNNAISMSLGGASSAYLNVFAIDNNVGALAFNSSELAINGSNRFGLSAYSSLFAAGCFSIEESTIGIAVSSAPLGNLAQHKIQLALSRKLGEKVSAGISLNYLNFSSTDAFYVPTQLFTFNVGLLYRINEKFDIGFQTANPNRTKLTNQLNERLPSEYRLGLRYNLGENINAYSDVIQRSNQRADASFGVELIKENYILRGGFGLNSNIALGFGYQKNKVSFDVAGTYHNQLGFSPSLNVNYAF